MGEEVCGGAADDAFGLSEEEVERKRGNERTAADYYNVLLFRGHGGGGSIEGVALLYKSCVCSRDYVPDWRDRVASIDPA